MPRYYLFVEMPYTVEADSEEEAISKVEEFLSGESNHDVEPADDDVGSITVYHMDETEDEDV